MMRHENTPPTYEETMGCLNGKGFLLLQCALNMLADLEKGEKASSERVLKDLADYESGLRKMVCTVGDFWGTKFEAGIREDEEIGKSSHRYELLSGCYHVVVNSLQRPSRKALKEVAERLLEEVCGDDNG